MFEHLGLESFAKSSGSKGLLIYLPLNTRTSYEETKPFARAVAETLEAQRPDLIVSNMKKSLQDGKVLALVRQTTPSPGRRKYPRRTSRRA
jgi:bifunctional non-homologous end joining protein LigD